MGHNCSAPRKPNDQHIRRKKVCPQRCQGVLLARQKTNNYSLKATAWNLRLSRKQWACKRRLKSSPSCQHRVFYRLVAYRTGAKRI